jgi:hypothetical protein
MGRHGKARLGKVRQGEEKKYNARLSKQGKPRQEKARQGQSWQDKT